MRPTSLAFGCALLSLSLSSAAQKKSVVARAPAGDKQAELVVGFTSDGALRAKVCTTSPCDPSGGTEIPLGADAKALAPKAKLSVGRIARARRVVIVEMADKAGGREWTTIVAAPIGGGTDPKVIFSGWTGLTSGEPGDRKGPLLDRAPNADGTWNVVIGEQREDLSLCGRKTILSPKLITPELKLEPAKVQRLQQKERVSARHVTARRLPADAPKKNYRLLRAFAASSAIGDPARLTDGDLETTWAENRGSDGRGEFVVMNAPSELPLSALEVVIRPPKGQPEHGAAAKDFWIATSSELVYVEMPEDAWKQPGARYEIPLDPPLKVDCVSLVTENGFSADKDARITFAELSARSEFDATTVDGLVGALAGGGARSEGAGEALRAIGPEAYDAIAKAFPKLDEGGRRVALAVIDEAPCATSVPVYIRALSSAYPAHRIHGRERLRRCGSDAGIGLAKALPAAQPRLRPLLASELALIDPVRAVAAITPLVAQADDKGRALLRKALGFATREPKTQPEVRRFLSDPALPEVTTIDLLRALGDRASAFQPAAGEALGRLLNGKASFRTRYLLVQPLARLAKSDPKVRALLARAMNQDESAYVRTEATSSVKDPRAFQSELLKSLEDSEVRVREAALETLSVRAGDFATEQILKRLSDDRWPLVRAAAASALARHGPSARVDDALVAGVLDPAPTVRAPVVLALGERKAIRHAEAVRVVLEEKDEPIEVRVSAALALGLMCDTNAVDILTDHALKLRDPMANADARALGPVALGALSRIKPPDLAKRLEPLLDKKTPLLLRRAAEAAVREPSTCGQRGRRAKR
jgi:hypothetical protein